MSTTAAPFAPAPSPAALWLGQAAVADGILTPAQLQSAIDRFRTIQRGSFPDVLEMLGMVSPRKIAELTARKFNLKVIELHPSHVDRVLAAKFPKQRALEHAAIPFRAIGRTIEFAVANPTNYSANDAARDFPGRDIVILVAPKKDIIASIEDVHRPEIAVENNADYLLGLIRELCTLKASDIHIEPREKSVRIRRRIDGVLEDHAYIAGDANNSLVQAVKTLARIPISERRLPADGTFSQVIGSRRYTFRVSTIPCIFGEKAEIRIQDENANILSFAELGMMPEDANTYSQLMQLPFGLIFHTGPTGSGKSTCMYSGLATLDARELNITTAEDPIEYVNPDYNQIGINERVRNEFTSLSYATILRAILRQDPDVIMIGETRDFETAMLTVQAALTGHLVLSTLHTNDACGTLSRLLAFEEQGLEPILVASAVKAAVGQRLLRRVCKECRTPHPQEDLMRDTYSLGKEGVIYIANSKGCGHCRNGYRGRIGIFEIFRFDLVSEMIAAGAHEHEIRRELITKHGSRTMREDGLRKVLLGLTTLEEVFSSLVL